MSSRQKARAAFASAVILVLVSAVAAVITLARLRLAQDWVTHTHQVESALADLNAAVSRSGRVRSEYINSGDQARLQEEEAAIAEIPRRLSTLTALTADNAMEQTNCQKLRGLTDERIHWVRESVNLKRTGQSDLEKQARITTQIVAVAAQTDAISQQMQTQERDLLELRTATARRLFGWMVFILLGSLAAGLGLFLIHFRLLDAELKAREEAQKSLRGLSARLLTLQDEERRRFSRELHDSLGQDLAALKMLLPAVDKNKPGDPALTECLQIVDKSISEIRTISHLLHPPLLDEAGLAVAARWYVDGFAQRSKIDVKMEIPENLPRLPSLVEVTLFRILQESLTNIHRHSGASRAEVTIARSAGGLTLRIRDYGTGISAETLKRFYSDTTGTGVGLAGMRERIRELGGRLDIYDDQGTVIEATVRVVEKTVANDVRGTAAS
jgi:signal transduction histidine kinase